MFPKKIRFTSFAHLEARSQFGQFIERYEVIECFSTRFVSPLLLTWKQILQVGLFIEHQEANKYFL